MAAEEPGGNLWGREGFEVEAAAGAAGKGRRPRALTKVSCGLRTGLCGLLGVEGEVQGATKH